MHDFGALHRSRCSWSTFRLPSSRRASPFAVAMLPDVNALADIVRRSGGTVAWTRHTWSDEPGVANPDWFKATLGPETRQWMEQLVPGNPVHDIHPDLEVDSKDIIVDKYRPSAFLPDHAGLNQRLRARGIDTVIVCGTVTSFCCQSTARDALMLDYRVCFPPDLNAGMTETAHRTTIADLETMGLFDLRSAQAIAHAMLGD